MWNRTDTGEFCSFILSWSKACLVPCLPGRQAWFSVLVYFLPITLLTPRQAQSEKHFNTLSPDSIFHTQFSRADRLSKWSSDQCYTENNFGREDLGDWELWHDFDVLRLDADLGSEVNALYKKRVLVAEYEMGDLLFCTLSVAWGIFVCSLELPVCGQFFRHIELSRVECIQIILLRHNPLLIAISILDEPALHRRVGKNPDQLFHCNQTGSSPAGRTLTTPPWTPYGQQFLNRAAHTPAFRRTCWMHSDSLGGGSHSQTDSNRTASTCCSTDLKQHPPRYKMHTKNLHRLRRSDKNDQHCIHTQVHRVNPWETSCYRDICHFHTH